MLAGTVVKRSGGWHSKSWSRNLLVPQSPSLSPIPSHAENKMDQLTHSFEELLTLPGKRHPVPTIAIGSLG